MRHNAYHSLVKIPSYWSGVIATRSEALTESVRESNESFIVRNSKIIELAERLRIKCTDSFFDVINSNEYKEYSNLTRINH